MKYFISSLWRWNR